MKLKQVIKYANANALEATWIEIITPEQIIPEHTIQASIDPVTGAEISEQTIPEQVIPAVEQIVKSHAYDDRQMDMLRADLGDEITPEIEELIADVLANQAPIPDPVPPTIKEQIAAIEATITNRRLREAALTEEGKAWLAAKDAEIAALRAQL